MMSRWTWKCFGHRAPPPSIDARRISIFQLKDEPEGRSHGVTPLRLSFRGGRCCPVVHATRPPFPTPGEEYCQPSLIPAQSQNERWGGRFCGPAPHNTPDEMQPTGKLWSRPDRVETEPSTSSRKTAGNDYPASLVRSCLAEYLQLARNCFAKVLDQESARSRRGSLSPGELKCHSRCQKSKALNCFLCISDNMSHRCL